MVASYHHLYGVIADRGKGSRIDRHVRYFIRVVGIDRLVQLPVDVYVCLPHGSAEASIPRQTVSSKLQLQAVSRLAAEQFRDTGNGPSLMLVCPSNSRRSNLIAGVIQH